MALRGMLSDAIIGYGLTYCIVNWSQFCVNIPFVYAVPSIVAVSAGRGLKT